MKHRRLAATLGIFALALSGIALVPTQVSAHVSDGAYEKQIGNTHACAKDRSKEGEANYSDPFHWNSYGKAVLYFDGIDVMKWTSTHGCYTDETDSSKKLVVPTGALFTRGVLLVLWDWEDGAEKNCTWNPGPQGDQNPAPASGYGWYITYPSPPCGITFDPGDPSRGGVYADYPNYADWDVIFAGQEEAGSYYNYVWTTYRGGTFPVAKSNHRYYARDYVGQEVPCVPIVACSQVDPAHPVPLYAPVASPYIDYSGDLDASWAGLPPIGDGNGSNP